MSDYFAVQPTSTAFSAVTLTNAYTGNRHILNADGMSKLSIDINYAMGGAETGNTMELLLEHSPDDGQNWYKLVIDTTTTVSTITPREWTMAPEKLNIIVDIAYKKMRMSIKETGVATNYGTATVVYTLSGQ
jgi:hypothetical protein